MTETSDPSNPLLGVWRIDRTNLWDRGELDLLGEARIVFLDDGLGSLRVGAMEAELDCRVREANRGWRADFSWSGFDDGAPASGRGSVRMVDADRLRGTLHVHLGDTCAFTARRVPDSTTAVPEARPESGACGKLAPSPPSPGDGSVAVRLADVLDALEYPEEWEVFLDRKTGRILAVTENERPYLEDPGLDLEPLRDLPAWLRSSVEDVLSVLETGDPVRLPGKFDVHEWSIMRRFADTCAESERRQILEAIHGRGAFRRFRAATERLGLREAWFRYRSQALERIARGWAEGEGIRLTGPEKRAFPQDPG